MKCDTGRIRAYLDDGLPASERAALERHLAGCSACQATLATFEQRRSSVDGWLAGLTPAQPPLSAPAALARLRAQNALTRPSLTERMLGMKETLTSRRWRPAFAGALVLLIVAALFSFTPVRQAAAEFLTIFRVQKFAAIPVDPAQIERLQNAERLLGSGFLGEPKFTREAGAPEKVADIAAASATAGYPVRVPGNLPAGLKPDEIVVQSGPAFTVQVERAKLIDLMQAIGVSGVELPAFDALTVQADIPTAVDQDWRGTNTRLYLLQVPSPSVNLSPDVDRVVMGEAFLRAAGVAPADAAKLAREIDWTTTLVLPMPTNMGSFEQITVDGAQGLLLRAKAGSGGDGPQGNEIVVLWERAGFIYAVGGVGLDDSALLGVANSLH